MEKRFKLILVSKSIHREVSLPEGTQKIKVGTFVDADARFPRKDFFEPFSFMVVNENGGWQIECDANLYVTDQDVRKLIVRKMEVGETLQIRYRSSGADVLQVQLLQDFDYKKRQYDRVIDLASVASLRIGGSTSSQIRLTHESAVGDNVLLTRTETSFELRTESREYGASVNGIPVEHPVILQPMDFIMIGPYSFCYCDRKLYTDSSAELVYSGVTYYDAPESLSHLAYPKFNRSTRVKEVIEEEKIEILDPPTAPTKPKNNIFQQLFPAVAMLVVTILLRGVLNTSSMTMILMSVCSIGIGVVTSVMSIVTERKEYAENVQKRESTYQTYLEQKKKGIEEKRSQEAQILERTYYPVSRELELASGFLPQLYEREPQDQDFLEVRLGTGEREALQKIDYKKKERVEAEDSLMELPGKVAEEYRMLKNVPVTMRLEDISMAGISGEREALYSMLKLLTLDLAVRHHESELQLYYCIGEEDQSRFSWLRMLPHVQNEVLGRRNIICDEESKGILLEYLFREISRRTKNSALPRMVVFVYRDWGIQNHPVSELVREAKEKGVTFLYFQEYPELLPKGCQRLIEMSDMIRGRVVDSSDGTKAQSFAAESVSDGEMAKLVRRLAPVYCEKISLESTLTQNITFFEMLGIYEPEDLDLGRNWTASEVYRSMAAPLGVKAKNQIICLDLNEKQHGPHGLVAGTTGSGKSEVLQSYVLSMALRFHPYEVGFVIIDFKGGGMVNQFRKLPHLIGAITNIDGREIDRSLMSIRAELKRRQELFAEYNVNHIDAYIRLYKQQKTSVPLPHLIIIVDEFAELKVDQPEFMKELISAARIGRSLGVHLILATQKPSGVVDPQIWSNSRFKLCLKVQSAQDSNEVLKNPLAAEIREPGRAYLQVGNNEIFELFQSAYSGAPAHVEGVTAKKKFSISRVNLSGKRTVVYEQKPEKSQEKVMTQLESVVSYVAAYCEKHAIQPLPYICLPPLPQLLPAKEQAACTDISSGLEVTIGLYDDPSRQYQGDLTLNVTSENTFVIGSAQYGKTNLLQSVLRGLTERYTPQQLNVYILDFGSMIFRNFESLHHVGGVVCSHEDEKCRNLFKLLNQEMKQRKEKLLQAGVSSYASYLEAGYTDLPQIVVMIDNLTALRELYLIENDVLYPICREGLTVGISFVAANAQTSGIGYKYLANFGQRMALYNNDSAEYSMLFESCRMRPQNLPGRCLVMKDKQIYEAQVCLAFEGEREVERAAGISKFIEQRNQICQDMYAKRIPVVPNELTRAVMAGFGAVSDNCRLAVGMDYATVAPVLFDWRSQNVLAVTGRNELGRAAFVQYLMQCLSEEEAELYILDGISGALSGYQNRSQMGMYSRSADEAGEMLAEFKLCIQERLHLAAEGRKEELAKLPPAVWIIEHPDVIAKLSGDRQLLAEYKDVLSKCKGMSCCIIYTNLENTAIGFNAPEVLKLIKENRQFLIFENLDQVKVMDLLPTVTRRFKKPLVPGDAYLQQGNDLLRLKTVSADERR